MAKGPAAIFHKFPTPYYDFYNKYHSKEKQQCLGKSAKYKRSE